MRGAVVRQQKTPQSNFTSVVSGIERTSQGEVLRNSCSDDPPPTFEESAPSTLSTLSTENSSRRDVLFNRNCLTGTVENLTLEGSEAKHELVTAVSSAMEYSSLIGNVVPSHYSHESIIISFAHVFGLFHMY